MAKNKPIYVCSACGYESPKWFGKCPGCNQWNTMNEELPNSAPLGRSRSGKFSSAVSQVMALGDITEDVEKRISTGNKEVTKNLTESSAAVLLSAV